MTELTDKEPAPLLQKEPTERPAWLRSLPQKSFPGVLDVVVAIQNWQKDERFKVGQIYYQKGGWEGWAQVELANGFTTGYPGLACQREMMVYANNRRRADLLLFSNDMTDPKQIVEVKCESLFQDAQGRGSYIDSMIEDLDKISDHRIKPEYLPARVMAMGSTFMDQVYEYATENDLANWGRYQNAVRYEQLASDLGNQYGLWSWYLVGERTSTGEVAWIPRDKDIKDEV